MWYLLCMCKQILLVVGALLLVATAVLILFPDTFLTQSSSDQEIMEVRSGTVHVVLSDNGYEPQEFIITKGTEVVFTTSRDKPHWPASNIHPTHEQYPAFDPERPVPAGESWSFVFEEPGLWHFHDHIRSYYTGTIHVVEE